MNRDKALSIADRIMTRIETDKAIHKDAIADEIVAGDALDEIVDVISHDGKKWVRRDGTAFDVNADQPKLTADLIIEMKKRAKEAGERARLQKEISERRTARTDVYGSAAGGGGGLASGSGGSGGWPAVPFYALTAIEIMERFGATGSDDKDTA